MNRLDILNTIAEKIKAKSYLEIGVFTGNVFNHINIPKKCGVDPNPECVATIHTTSDIFFENNKETFDLIFIDGLHTEEQVYKDILNSLNVLNNNGYIVCHDMLPTTKIMQEVPRKQDEWTGDVWKSWVKLRASRSDLFMCVVDTDYGCGIIRNGKQSTISVHDELTYENFELNKQYWMNIISINDFKNNVWFS
jgi:hypothetical protein